MSRICSLAVIIVTAVAMLTGQGFAQSDTVPAASIVAEFDDLSAVGRAITLVSPDGRSVAYMEPSNLCIYDLADAVLSGERCVSTAELRLWNYSLRWSPDSRWLVLTENWLIFLYEPDIWVINSDTLGLSNLTDDGLSGGLTQDSPDRNLDVFPDWYRADDGTYRIAFLRLDLDSDDGSAMLMSIGIEDVQPTEMGQLPNTGSIPNAFAISPDGSQTAYAPFDSEGDLCLYLTSVADLTPRTLSCTSSRGEIPQVLQFNAASDHLMALRFYRAMIGTGPRTAQIWNVSSGEEIVPDLAEDIVWAMWGNRGSSLITLADEGDGMALYYSASAGAEAGRILMDDFVPAPNDSVVPGRLSRSGQFVIGLRESPAIRLIEIDLPSSGWG